MKISELAHAVNIPAKTIRYYEQVGLIAPASRTASGYRHYTKKDVETLVFIRRCRELNIALEDIKQLLEVQQNPQASCAVVDEMIATQLTRIQQAQRELAQLEQSLTTLATSCAHQKVADCSILQHLKKVGAP